MGQRLPVWRRCGHALPVACHPPPPLSPPPFVWIRPRHRTSATTTLLPVVAGHHLTHWLSPDRHPGQHGRLVCQLCQETNTLFRTRPRLCASVVACGTCVYQLCCCSALSASTWSAVSRGGHPRSGSVNFPIFFVSAAAWTTPPTLPGRVGLGAAGGRASGVRCRSLGLARRSGEGGRGCDL